MCDIKSDYKFGIIIPTFGRSEKLRSVVSNVLGNAADVSVIIVDDNGKGTKDQINTQNILKEFLVYDQVKYIILDKNLGASLARNEGVRHSDCEIVTFMDDDDTLYIDSLVDKYQFFISTSAQLCGSNMNVSGDVSKWNILKKGLEKKFLSKTPLEMLTHGNCFTPMIMIYKKDFLELNGFEKVSYFQDHIFMLKFHIAKKSVVHFNKPTFCHNIHSGSRITNNQNKKPDGIETRLELESELMKLLNLSFIDGILYKFRRNELLYYKANIVSGLNRWEKTFFILTKIFPYSISLSRLCTSIKLFIKGIFNA